MTKIKLCDDHWFDVSTEKMIWRTGETPCHFSRSFPAHPGEEKLQKDQISDRLRGLLKGDGFPEPYERV